MLQDAGELSGCATRRHGALQRNTVLGKDEVHQHSLLTSCCPLVPTGRSSQSPDLLGTRAARLGRAGRALCPAGSWPCTGTTPGRAASCWQRRRRRRRTRALWDWVTASPPATCPSSPRAQRALPDSTTATLGNAEMGLQKRPRGTAAGHQEVSLVWGQV